MHHIDNHPHPTLPHQGGGNYVVKSTEKYFCRGLRLVRKGANPWPLTPGPYPYVGQMRWPSFSESLRFSSKSMGTSMRHGMSSLRAFCSMGRSSPGLSTL